MASRSLTVIAKVKDAASDTLKKIQGSFQGVNKEAKNTGANFDQFNKIMFITTAYVGAFVMAFSKMSQAITEAGDLDRLSEQFERVAGPKGEMFQAISSMTKNSIDKMEAMRAGIAISNLGIAKNTNQVAEIIARAGTAAKRSGLHSAEGIKKVTEFLKTGEVSNLSFLNVLTATNPALQMQMAILQKAGGIMGGVISTQAKLRMGMAALRAATQGMGDDSADLADTMANLSQSFSFLKNETFRLLGKALTPIFEKITEVADSVTSLVERLRTADPSFMKTIKNFAIIASGIATTIGVIGTLRLVMKALTAVGIGPLPLLALAITTLTGSFFDQQQSIDILMNTLKKFGSIAMGVFQLVSSFLQDPENFAKGIGKMDKSVHDFLQSNGLLNLTITIARVSAVIITFVQDTGNQLIKWFTKAREAIQPFIDKINKMFDASTAKAWSRSWIEGGEGIRGMLIKLTAGAIIAGAAFKLLSIGKGVLSKIPVVGKLFGGGGLGGGPKGTSSDPIYVKDTSIASKATAGLELGGLLAMFKKFAFADIIAKVKTSIEALGFYLEYGKIVVQDFISSAIGPLKAGFKSFNLIILAIISAAGAITGIYEGLLETGSGFFTFMESIGNLGGAIFSVVENFLKSNSILSTIWSALKTVASAFMLLPKSLFEMIAEGWKQIAGWLGIGAELLGQKINELSVKMNMSTASDINNQNSNKSLSDLGLSFSAPTGQTSVASVPTMPGSTADQIALVQQSASHLEGGAQAKMTEQLRNALNDGKITPEEWVMIFADGVNKSKVTEHVEAQAKKPIPTKTFKSQRC